MMLICFFAATAWSEPDGARVTGIREGDFHMMHGQIPE